MTKFDKELFELQKESQSLYSEVINKLKSKEQAYKALGRFNRGFYSKTQSELMTLMRNKNLQFPNGKISSVFDRIHFKYRIIGLKLFLIDIERKDISRDPEGLLERSYTNGILCRDNFKKVLSDMHFKWKTPVSDLEHLLRTTGQRLIEISDPNRVKKLYDLVDENIRKMEEVYFKGTRFDPNNQGNITNLNIRPKALEEGKQHLVKIGVSIDTTVPVQLTLLEASGNNIELKRK